MDKAISSKAWPAITQAMLVGYAKVSGDNNPIHQDEAVAKKAGLPGVIALGMLTAAFVAERAVLFMAEESGLVGFRLEKFSTRFKAMTFLGDVISVEGMVRSAEGARVVLDLTARNQKGETTTTGWAEFGKPGA